MHPGVHAATNPDKAAFIVAAAGSGETVSVSYRQLDENSNRLARLLHDNGLRTGDVVAILMENNAAFLEVVWAAQRSGLYHTAINTRLTPSETAFIVNDSGAAAIIASHALAPTASAILADAPGLATRLMVDGTVDGYDSYEQAIAGRSPDPLPAALEGRELLYSSGTTGRPKGVKPALRGVPLGTPDYDSLVRLAVPLYGLAEDSVLLSPAPLYHAAPLRFAIAATRLGATTVVMDHFEPAEFLAVVERLGRQVHAEGVEVLPGFEEHRPATAADIETSGRRRQGGPVAGDQAALGDVPPVADLAGGHPVHGGGVGDAEGMDLALPQAAELTVFCGSLVGASLGFLWYNSYPAEIFMGDVGSLALGAALGIVAILIKQELLLPIVGGVFVLEALSVVVQVGYFKATGGQRIFRMAPLHHHFELSGWSEPKVITRFVIVGIMFALFSLATLKLR